MRRVRKPSKEFVPKSIPSSRSSRSRSASSASQCAGGITSWTIVKPSRAMRSRCSCSSASDILRARILQRRQRRIGDLALHELAVLVEGGDVRLPVAVLVLFALHEHRLAADLLVGLEDVGLAVLRGVALDADDDLLAVGGGAVVGPGVDRAVAIAVLL